MPVGLFPETRRLVSLEAEWSPEGAIHCDGTKGRLGEETTNPAQAANFFTRVSRCWSCRTAKARPLTFKTEGWTATEGGRSLFKNSANSQRRVAEVN